MAKRELPYGSRRLACNWGNSFQEEIWVSISVCPPLTTYPPQALCLSSHSSQSQLLRGAQCLHSQSKSGGRKLPKHWGDHQPPETKNWIAFEILALSQKVWRRCMRKKQQPVTNKTHCRWLQAHWQLMYQSLMHLSTNRIGTEEIWTNRKKSVSTLGKI